MSGVVGDLFNRSTAPLAFLIDADNTLFLGVFADETDDVAAGGNFFDAGNEDGGDGDVVGVNEAQVAVFECPDFGAGGVGDL